MYRLDDDIALREIHVLVNHEGGYFLPTFHKSQLGVVSSAHSGFIR